MQAPETRTALARDLALLENAVREAGRVALAFFGKAPKSWTKEFNSPVSEADLAADDTLRQALGEARPDYGWVSEESGRSDHANEAPVWMVDPIDGTRAFLKERPEWTVSVALVASGRPIVAAVFNPAREEMFLAAKGFGATLNGASIAATALKRLDGARLVAHESDLRGKNWTSPWPAIDVSQVGSMAYRLCLVAQGRCDATVSVTAKSDWDLAAADLIVREAGGMASTFNGDTFVYNRADFRHANVVGAGTALHQSILHHISASYSR